ncbi:MAG: cobalt ECF transporter T component CbiQ [Chloroflexi bacterium]|nr:cobalt ECF transporter T component CbiQ [Chloroflexota bacterium]
MNLGLDEYAHLDSPLHRWEPRCKFVGLIVLIFAFSFVQDLRLMLAVLAVTFALYVVSRLPLSFLLSRLRAPGFFLLIMVILLPLFSGSTVLLHIGPLALRREGCLDLLLVVTKFVSILAIGLVLFGTAPFLITIKAMRALGLPSVLSDMTLLSYRYLYEIGDDLEAMETAMGLRGFRTRRLSGRAVGVLASLAGSILVRSYEQSERVYRAMVLRGYGRSPRPRDEFETDSRDVVLLGTVLLVAAVFVAVEIFIRGFRG